MDKKVGVGVGVMILRDGKVLLGKRHDDPEKADSELHGEGTWTMPGGKLDFGETFEVGAKREVSEETGLKLGKVQVICVNEEIIEDAHFVTIGILCTDFDGEPVVKEPEEITEWKWYDLDQLPNPLYTPSAKILRNRKENKFYIPNNDN